MIEGEFTSGDLYGLEICLRDMDEMIDRGGEIASDKAVRYALIKTFELTFEMAVKALRKFLIARSLTKSTEAATFEYQDLIRLADQEGLVQNGWPHWKRYRDHRARTVHTYGEAMALQISAQLEEFSKEVHVLLQHLRRAIGERNA